MITLRNIFLLILASVIGGTIAFLSTPAGVMFLRALLGTILSFLTKI